MGYIQLSFCVVRWRLKYTIEYVQFLMRPGGMLIVRFCKYNCVQCQQCIYYISSSSKRSISTALVPVSSLSGWSRYLSAGIPSIVQLSIQSLIPGTPGLLTYSDLHLCSDLNFLSILLYCTEKYLRALKSALLYFSCT